MFRLFILICAVATTALLGCKKTVDNLAENRAIELISDTPWRVTIYARDTDTLTSYFKGYTFVFKENKTVDAVKSQQIVKSGVWDFSFTQQSILSAFSTTEEPLVLLNGTWNIVNITNTTVLANQTINGKMVTLKLAKA